MNPTQKEIDLPQAISAYMLHIYQAIAANNSIAYRDLLIESLKDEDVAVNYLIGLNHTRAMQNVKGKYLQEFRQFLEDTKTTTFTSEELDKKIKETAASLDRFEGLVIRLKGTAPNLSVGWVDGRVSPADLVGRVLFAKGGVNNPTVEMIKEMVEKDLIQDGKSLSQFDIEGINYIDVTAQLTQEQLLGIQAGPETIPEIKDLHPDSIHMLAHDPLPDLPRSNEDSEYEKPGEPQTPSLYALRPNQQGGAEHQYKTPGGQTGNPGFVSEQQAHTDPFGAYADLKRGASGEGAIYNASSNLHTDSGYRTDSSGQNGVYKEPRGPANPIMNQPKPPIDTGKRPVGGRRRVVAARTKQAEAPALNTKNKPTGL